MTVQEALRQLECLGESEIRFVLEKEINFLRAKLDNAVKEHRRLEKELNDERK